jgi:methyl-accepting chemotaxis protein
MSRGTNPFVTPGLHMSLRNRRVSLKTKLFGLSGILLALTALIALSGVRSLGGDNDAPTALYQQGAKPLADIAAVRARTNDSRRLVAGLILGVADPGYTAADRKDDVATIAENDAEIQERLASLDASLKDPALRRRLAIVKSGYPAWQGPRDALLKRIEAAGADTGPATTESVQQFGVIAAANRRINGAPYKILKDNNKIFSEEIATWAKNRNAEAEATFSSARTQALVLLIVALIVGFGIAFLVARGITRIVGEILQRVRSLGDNCLTDLQVGLTKMSEGDLTHATTPVTKPIERFPNDELGDIAQAINDMRLKAGASIEGYNASRTSLTGMIDQVAQTAQSLSASSQQMASTSEEAGRAVGEIAHAVSDVAQGAERQARTAESTRTVADEMSTATTQGSEAVQQTATAAEQARAAALEGQTAAGRSATAMTEMHQVSAGTIAAMEELGEKSERIGGIVDTITGIAGQTNLLALNAAIEAARAGEQGRGFAVVAEQVRKLAEESQDAAASIAGLVQEIQGSTAHAVEVIGSGSASIDECVAASAVTEEAFTRITGSVDDVHGRIEQIGVVMGQITASADRVRDDISDVAAIAEESSASSEQVSASTQETSASTQEVAASAQELARTAEELEALCARFTLTAS